MLTILITGANGQLGQELTEMLRTGHSEIGDIPAAYQGANLILADIDTVDITDTVAVFAFVDQCRPDVIFNCAAMTNVNGCESDYASAMRINAIGVRNLARAAEKAGAKFVHVSTDYVFSGEMQAKPYCEWDLPAPNTVYGKSKWLGEQYAMQFCTRTFVVRTAWLYGRYGNNFVRTMQKLGKEKPFVSVVNDQRGNPTNANDLAYHLLLLGLTEEYGIYHCTGNGECSWYEFATEIMRLSGLACEVRPCTTAEYPTPAKRPAYSSLSHLMLSVTVGDHMRDWKDALTAFLTQTKPTQM